MNWDFIAIGNCDHVFTPSGAIAAVHTAMSLEFGSYATNGICTGYMFKTAFLSDIPGLITGYPEATSDMGSKKIPA